jgi:hypothetical protein
MSQQQLQQMMVMILQVVAVPRHAAAVGELAAASSLPLRWSCKQCLTLTWLMLLLRMQVVVVVLVRGDAPLAGCSCSSSKQTAQPRTSGTTHLSSSSSSRAGDARQEAGRARPRCVGAAAVWFVLPLLLLARRRRCAPRWRASMMQARCWQASRVLLVLLVDDEELLCGRRLLPASTGLLLATVVAEMTTTAATAGRRRRMA